PSGVRAYRQPVPGDIDGPGEPDVALAQHLLDQAIEHAHAGGPAHDLRVEHQVVEAGFLVLALELLRPDLPHVLLAPDAVAGGRVGAEAEVHEVVVDPARGQLHEIAVGRLVTIGEIGVHHVGV